jgi:hypothetical protein
MTHATTAAVRPAWRVLQGLTLLATVGFLLAAWFRPQPSLALFWGVVVPLLPLTFLVSPLLWRGLCPLATLNQLGNRATGGRRLPASLPSWAGLPAIVLLFVLVPARHVVFNSRGDWLVLTIVAVGLLAFALGRRYDARAGFCNLLCPVLPVERLYGQRPLLVVENGRCARCSACTPRGCLDLARERTVAQVLGPGRRRRDWVRAPFAAFATAFPGFVLGYFTVADVSPSQSLALYAHVLGLAAASALVLSLLLWGAAVSAARALPWLAALSAVVYYWFAVPGLLGALGVSAGALVWGGRVVVLLAVGAWLQRATAEEGRVGRRLAVVEAVEG